MVAKSLYGVGYEVDTCYDGEEALECILTEDYDLIVLDLNLPGMDGMEILRELRRENGRYMEYTAEWIPQISNPDLDRKSVV